MTIIHFIPGVLTGEGGLRLDHSVVYGGGELLQTYPVVNPRLRLTYTFLKNWGKIQSMDLNGGSGLYSQFPADNQYLDSQFGVASLAVGPTRAWFNVLGLDILGTGGETFNLQGYYKYYLDRFYTATTRRRPPARQCSSTTGSATPSASTSGSRSRRSSGIFPSATPST